MSVIRDFNEDVNWLRLLGIIAITALLVVGIVNLIPMPSYFAFLLGLIMGGATASFSMPFWLDNV